MPIQTLKLAVTNRQGVWSRQNASSHHEALDSPDSSYLFHSGSINQTLTSSEEANFSLETPSIPGTAKIRAVRFVFRHSRHLSFSVTTRVRLRSLASPTTAVVRTVEDTIEQAGDLEPDPHTLIRQRSSPWWTTWRSGLEWTISRLVNSTEVQVGKTNPGRVRQIWVEVEYNERPVVTLTAPTGTITDSSRPLTEFDYSDPEDDSLAESHLRIFKGPPWPSNPLTSTQGLEWESLGTTEQSIRPDRMLTSGIYRVYARARQVWDGVGQHWSALDERQFELSLNVGVPELQVTVDKSKARVLLQTDPGSEGALTDFIRVIRSDDDGQNWQIVRGADQLQPVDAIHDYEAPLHKEVLYSAHGIREFDPGDLAASNRSIPQAVMIDSQGRWIKNPLDPTTNLEVNVSQASGTFIRKTGVFHPEDPSGEAIVVSGSTKFHRHQWEIFLLSDEDWERLKELVETSHILLIQSRREHEYVKITNDVDWNQAAWDGSGYRRLTLEMEKVTKP